MSQITNFNDIPGSNSTEELYSSLVMQYPDGAIFAQLYEAEGRQASFMATVLRASGRFIKFHVISEWEDKQYETFIENMKSCGIVEYIVPKRVSPHVAYLNYPNRSLDAIFFNTVIDLDRNIRNWYPKLKVGGIIAGDGMNRDHVKATIINLFGKNLTEVHNFCWIYYKLGHILIDDVKDWSVE